MIDDDLVRAHRARALTPEHPFVRGTAHNPDTFFQAREAVNPFYARVPAIVAARDGALRGADRPPLPAVRVRRRTRTPNASSCMMGSGAETARETAACLCARGETRRRRAGAAVPPVPGRRVPGRAAADVRGDRGARADEGARRASASRSISTSSTTLRAGGRGGTGSAPMPRVIGGRYGLSSKDFTPAMVKAVFDELARTRAEERLHRRHRRRRLAHAASTVDPRLRRSSRDDVVRAVFYGLGADGTVGANKNSVKIIAEDAGAVRAGLLRLRLAQVGRADGLAPALRPAPDPAHRT